MRRASLLVLCVAGWLAVPQLRADLTVGPAQWTSAQGGDDHWYELVLPDSSQSTYSWTQARQAADSMTYNGLQGYLATVTSQAENDFLGANFASHLFDNGPLNIGVGPTNSTYAWIGLFAPTPTSDFQWVTGEPVSYTNWAPSEPNSFGTPFWQFTHYWTRDFGNGPTWTWNNEQNQGFELSQQNNDRTGFIVEFGGGQDISAVPEPSTGLFVGLGLLGIMIGAVWKRI